MSKVLNPVIVKFAGRRHFGMAAQIQLWAGGRGRSMWLPRPHTCTATILIGLTFGNQSDWARNVRAVGGRQVRVNGRPCQATSPRFLGRKEAAGSVHLVSGVAAGAVPAV